jgi:microcystin-dependent protein
MSKVGKPNVTGVDVTPFVNVQFDKGSIGEIKAFAGNVDGIHYLACDGSAVNRGTYAELFAAIGITHGQGDGSTTFNLPDYRGRFLRGVTGVSSNDPDAALRTAMNTGGNTGNNVGSVQTDTFASHTHNWTGATNDSYSGGTPLADIGSGTFATPGITLSSGGNETRPKNAYVNYGIRFKAANEAILAPTETFSTDTASLSYASSAAYTLSTLQNAPVGTFITFTYAANTNTRTQTTTAPTQSTADMNTNGILLYTRAYNAASTAANPAAVAIQIGKGLKGKSLDLYKSAGKVNSGSLDMYGAETTTYTLGVHLNTYNESTGILLVDAGYRYANAAVNCFLLYADGTTQTSGYLVINASKSPALTGVPLLQPRIATLSDVKASGTAGGTATAGSYQTRTLNTLSDPSGIVTSLASNQFVLPAGEYYIEVSAPAAAVGRHKIKIRNITDSTDSILGTAEFTAVAATYTTRAFLSGNIVISSSKSFELQHRVETTKTSDGFGVATSFGDSEVYSIVKITKVK